MTPPTPSSSSSSARPPVGGMKPPAQKATGTLDLLMDMEMPVLVRFASTRMALRELLALEAGEIV